MAPAATYRLVRWAASVTIQELGSIGELIAAIATIATLVYLALQIKGSAASVRAEGRRAFDTDLNEAIRQIGGDPEVAQLFMLGLGRPNELDPAQMFRFHLFMSHFFSQQDTAWKEVRLGTISQYELSESINRSRPFLESPGGRAWWQANSRIFSAEFRRYFESAVPAVATSDSKPEANPGP